MNETLLKPRVRGVGSRRPATFASAVQPWAAFALGLVALFGTARARACDCPALTPEDAYREADAVFEGRVLSVDPGSSPPSARSAQLHVVRAWKGVTKEQVTLRFESDCAPELQPKESFLVYAKGAETELVLPACGRTRPMAAADDDLRVLGMGVTPFDPKAVPTEAVATTTKPHEPPARGGCASCAAAGGADAAGFPAAVTLLAFALRRRALSYRRS